MAHKQKVVLVDFATVALEMFVPDDIEIVVLDIYIFFLQKKVVLEMFVFYAVPATPARRGCDAEQTAQHAARCVRVSSGHYRH